MSSTSSQKPAFLPTLRALVRAMQAYEYYENCHCRQVNLTPAQLDIIFTLGNTPGMNFGTLSEKTLITKGTLTGVVDRLEEKGLVERIVPPHDRRSLIAKLTPAGEKVFNALFLPHLAYVGERFNRLPPQELEQLTMLLEKLRATFEEPPTSFPLGDRTWEDF